MLDQLFNSKTRVKILALLFQHEDKKVYVQEVIKLAKTDSANTHRELMRLNKFSVLCSERVGNRKYYFLNKNSAHYKGLKELFKKYNNEQLKDEWFILEEIPPKINPNGVIAYMHIPYVNAYLKKQGFKNKIKASLAEFNKQSVNLYFLVDDFQRLEKEIFKKLISDSKWGLKYIQDTIVSVENYFSASKKVYSTNLKNLTNKQLYDLYIKHFNAELEMRFPGWIQNTVEMDKQLFSKYLLEYLGKKIKESNIKKSVGDIFSLLTTPLDESYAQKEHQDLLKICLEIKKDKKLHGLFTKNELRIVEEEISQYKNINSLLNCHVLKYGWLSYQFIGPGWKKDYFIDTISSLLRQKIDIKKSLAEEKNKLLRLKKEQLHLITELRIDPHHKDLLDIAKGMVYTKGARKDSMFYGYYCQDFMNKEIARRKYLSIGQVRNIYFWELKDVLLKDKNISNELNQRLNYHIYLLQKNQAKIYIGEKARTFIKSIKLKKESVNEDTKELLGACAAPGKTRGMVHIVNISEDMKDFKEHNILVSIATSPDLMPAIKKSNAIITDIGGMTCHAAIISRELGKPCIIGTRIATKVLKNGDLVDVDATHGRVTILKKIK